GRPRGEHRGLRPADRHGGHVGHVAKDELAVLQRVLRRSVGAAPSQLAHQDASGLQLHRPAIRSGQHRPGTAYRLISLRRARSSSERKATEIRTYSTPPAAMQVATSTAWPGVPY